MRGLDRVVFQYGTDHGTEAGKGESLNETDIDYKAWCESRFSKEYLIYLSFDPDPQTPRRADFFVIHLSTVCRLFNCSYSISSSLGFCQLA